LLGGEPGIGKSTLLLQVAGALAGRHPVLYVTGEESTAQVGQRAGRLGGAWQGVQVAAETDLDTVLALAQAQRPALLLIDSIQTMQLAGLPNAAGAVTQLRECTAALVRFAKGSGTAVLIVGHVTKDGAIAGPRLLEHLVDTVLYFERDAGSRFRRVRAAKNRFGAANELGFFLMQENGLKEVKNPSAIFLARAPQPVAGSIVMVTRDGNRPLLVVAHRLADAPSKRAELVAILVRQPGNLMKIDADDIDQRRLHGEPFAFDAHERGVEAVEACTRHAADDEARAHGGVVHAIDARPQTAE
jgi:DNA repair protein RadA/Sms